MKCEASRNDTYSRRKFLPCGAPAKWKVSLYGVALSSRGKYTPMCSKCKARTMAKWPSAKAESL